MKLVAIISLIVTVVGLAVGLVQLVLYLGQYKDKKNNRR